MTRRFVSYPCSRCGKTADGEIVGYTLDGETDPYFERRLYCVDCADDFFDRLAALELKPGTRFPDFDDDAFRSTRP